MVAGKDETASKDTVFSGRLISVRVDTLTNGKKREVVVHPGAAAVCAVESGQIVLVQQYRHPVKKDMWEIPAGLLEPKEDALECAKRELHEETGLKARSWQHMTSFYSSPGCMTELIHLYLARDLTKTDSEPDEEEIGRIDRIPLPVARAMVRDGRVQDAKTIIAISLGSGNVICQCDE